jgi:hypothetical protein
MDREEDRLIKLLMELRERVGLVSQNLRELEPPEQHELWVLRALQELLKNSTFQLFYPADRFPELNNYLVQALMQMQKQKWKVIAEVSVLKLSQIEAPLVFESISKVHHWAASLGWFIPRKYRSDIIGDILEDCVEMRKAGCSERRIKFHIVYQWLIAVITLVPTAAKNSIVDAVKQVISPPR